MIIAPHALTGAAIATRVRRPWLAILAAFGSHFLLDYVPHIESTTLFQIGGGPAWAVLTVEAVDFLVTVGLLAWAVPGRPEWRIMLLAAFAGILIDLVESVPGGEAWFSTWGGTSWLYSFHRGFHHNVPHEQWPLGVATQAAVIVIALLVISRTKAGKKEHKI
jgi:hypothetical protein